MALEEIALFFCAMLVIYIAIIIMVNRQKAKERKLFDFYSEQTPEKIIARSPWYRKPFLVVIASIICLPVGMWGIYRNLQENRRKRMLMI